MSKQLSQSVIWRAYFICMGPVLTQRPLYWNVLALFKLLDWSSIIVSKLADFFFLPIFGNPLWTFWSAISIFFVQHVFIKWQVYTFSVINNYDRLIAIHTFWMTGRHKLFIRWQVYTLSVINHCARLIAIHTFWMFRWQEGLFCNWPAIVTQLI